MISKKEVMFGLLGLVLMIGFVSAFGVGGKFSNDENRYVKMYPGEVAIVNVYLQNMVGDNDYTFTARMKKDGDGVAKLAHEEPIYAVPAKTGGVAVPIELTIPTDTELGEYFEFELFFNQAPSADSGGGNVQVVGGVNWKIGVIVVEEGQSTFFDAEETKPKPIEEPERNNTLWYIIAAIVVIVAILYFVTRKKKK